MTEAICAGIFNDLGSGSNVDVCVITKVCVFLESLSFSEMHAILKFRINFIGILFTSTG